MQPDQPALPQITDEDLVRSRPAVRALAVARYERLWRQVDVYLQQAEATGLPPDPRMLEFGLRVNKELVLTYQLLKNVAVPEEEDLEQLGAEVDRRALAEQSLQELEQKLRPKDA